MCLPSTVGPPGGEVLLLPGQRGFHARLGVGPDVGRQAVADVLAHDALRVHAVDAQVFGVGKAEAQAGVEVGDQAGHVVGDGLQETLVVAQRDLGGLAARDVHHRGVAAQEMPVRVAHRRRGQQRMEGAAIAPAHLVLHTFQCVVVQDLAHAGFEQRHVGGRNDVAKAHLAHHLVAAVAQPPQLGVVDRHEDAVDVQRVVAARRLVVERLRLAQGLVELGVGVADLVFRGLALGDVEHLDEQAGNLAVVPVGGVVDAGVEHRAVGEHAFAFEALGRAGQRAFQARACRLEVLACAQSGSGAGPPGLSGLPSSQRA